MLVSECLRVCVCVNGPIDHSWKIPKIAGAAVPISNCGNITTKPCCPLLSDSGPLNQPGSLPPVASIYNRIRVSDISVSTVAHRSDTHATSNVHLSHP